MSASVRRGGLGIGSLAWKVLILSSALVFVSSCGDRDSVGPQPTDPLTGIWEGSVDGQGLRMELSEAEPGLITGRILLITPEETVILPIDHGSRPEPDSLYLDVSGSIPPPFGCTRIFSGRRLDEHRISGQAWVRCGHDPPTITSWSATRLP